MRSVVDLYDELKNDRDTKELVTWFPPIELPSKEFLENYPRESITDVLKAGYQIIGAIELIKQ